MEKHCLWTCSSWLSYTAQTDLPKDGTSQSWLNPYPLIIDKENSLTDMHTGQSDEPQLRFLLPRCVKLTIRISHHAHSCKEPNEPIDLPDWIWVVLIEDRKVPILPHRADSPEGKVLVADFV